MNLQNRVRHLINKSIEAQTDRWFDAREKMISATDIGAILGINMKKTKNDLLHNKLYNIRSIDTKHTLHGKKFEPIAIQQLENMRNIKIEEVGFVVSEQSDFIGATPDGITIENGEIKLIEIKCPLTRQIDGCIPLNYYMQIQIQLYTCDAEECLFFECDFEEVSQQKYNKLDNDIRKGYDKASNSFWVLHDSNLMTIKRDRVFFEKYFGDLKKFAMTLRSENQKLKQKRNTRKRKMSFIDEQPNKRRRFDNLISFSQIKNYTTNNKCDAWLNIHGNDLISHSKKENKLAEQIQRRIKQMSKSYLEDLIRRCEKNNLSYFIVPEYFTYNDYLVELTQRCINDGVDVIYNPMLMSNKNNIYCKVPVIVKAKVVDILFKENTTNTTFSRRQMNHYVVLNKVSKTLKYIKNGTELSQDLKHRNYIQRNLFATYMLNEMQNFNMDTSLIVGNKWFYIQDKKTYTGMSNEKIAVICHELNNQIELTKYRKWLEEIINQKDKYICHKDQEYMPYYSKNENNEWSEYKKQLLESKRDVSLLYGIGRKTRALLNNHGVYSWDDNRLMEILNNEDALKIFKINKKDANIMKHIITFNTSDNEHYIIPREIKNVDNWFKEDSLEFYVDFETSNDFLGDINMIYMIGMYCKLPNGKFEYHAFFADNLILHDERVVMNQWLNKMNELKQRFNVTYNPKIYCWSKAEFNFINAYNRRHMENVKVNLCDMLDVIKKEIILIKGNIYGFSIKDVVKYMYKHKMISRNYKLACSSGDLSIISAINYYKHDDQKEYQDLIKYNETDCIVMFDIIDYLRKYYSDNN